MNRFASLAILPMMVLAIVVFGRWADDVGSAAEKPRDGRLVVANLRDETLTFIDLDSGERRDLVLPGPPHEMVEAGGRLYVTLGRGNALVEVEPDAPAILRVLPLEGEPHGIAVFGENLIVTLDRANQALFLDRATLSELRRYPTGNTPHMVVAGPRSIAVTDSRDNVLRLLEPSHATASTGAMPEGLAVVGTRVVSADAESGTVTIANAVDLAGPRQVRVGAGPVRVAAFDPTSALVSLQASGEIVVVDIDLGQVTRRLKTVRRPDGICLSGDGAYFSVASNAGDGVEVFSTEDWKPVSRLNLADGLGSCLWLGER